MLQTIEWAETPTYFIGRNGAYSQVGMELLVQKRIDPCLKDPKPGPPGVEICPVSHRGHANCIITVPLSKIDELIDKLQLCKVTLMADGERADQTGKKLIKVPCGLLCEGIDYLEAREYTGVRHLVYVEFNGVIAPKTVFENLCKSYSNVATSRSHEPLLTPEAEHAKLYHPLLVNLSHSWLSGDMQFVGSMRFLGYLEPLDKV